MFGLFPQVHISQSYLLDQLCQQKVGCIHYATYYVTFDKCLSVNSSADDNMIFVQSVNILCSFICYLKCLFSEEDNLDMQVAHLQRMTVAH